jgi:hypothetical protein
MHGSNTNEISKHVIACINPYSWKNTVNIVISSPATLNAKISGSRRVNKYFGAKVPDNVDFLQIYIPGGRSGFGVLSCEGSPNDTSYATLDVAKNKALQVFNQYGLQGIASKTNIQGLSGPKFRQLLLHDQRLESWREIRKD